MLWIGFKPNDHPTNYYIVGQLIELWIGFKPNDHPTQDGIKDYSQELWIGFKPNDHPTDYCPNTQTKCCGLVSNQMIIQH